LVSRRVDPLAHSGKEILVAIDRAGWLTARQIMIAAGFGSIQTTRRRTQLLRAHGLIAAQTFPRPGGGRNDWAHVLSPAGWKALQDYLPLGWTGPEHAHRIAARDDLEFRPAHQSFDPVRVRDSWDSCRHDLGATSVTLTVAEQLRGLLDEDGERPVVTWQREVRFVPERIGRRWPDLGDVQVPAGTQRYTLVDPTADAPRPQREIRADALVEVWWRDGRRQDVLIEYDHLTKRTDNEAKFARYDAFLAGWWVTLARYRHQLPPILLFVAPGWPSPRARRACEIARGLRIGLKAGHGLDVVAFPARDRTVVASYESVGDVVAATRTEKHAPAPTLTGWRPGATPLDAGRTDSYLDVIGRLSTVPGDA
jgi:hypothetical protein